MIRRRRRSRWAWSLLRRRRGKGREGRLSPPLVPAPTNPWLPSWPVSAPPAIRKLRAAETLAGSGQGPEALNLAAASMLLSVAGAAEETPPPLERAAVWLHGDMVPRGFLASEQAAAISRALALAGAADVPPELVEDVLADARALVETFV